MAPPPGLFSTITGWPRLSESFWPNTRAMMSLPPPAAKPTMMRIGLAGYSWAFAGAVNESRPIAPIRRCRARIFIGSLPGSFSQSRHMNMQYRGLAVIHGGKAAVDGGGKLIRLTDAFAMRAERFSHFRKVTPLALASRHQPRLELVGLGCDSLGIDTLRCRLHRLPAAIVEHDGENRDLV